MFGSELTLISCNKGLQAGQQVPHIDMQIIRSVLDLVFHGGKRRGGDEKSGREENTTIHTFLINGLIETAETWSKRDIKKRKLISISYMIGPVIHF